MVVFGSLPIRLLTATVALISAAQQHVTPAEDSYHSIPLDIRSSAVSAERRLSSVCLDWTRTRIRAGGPDKDRSTATWTSRAFLTSLRGRSLSDCGRYYVTWRSFVDAIDERSSVELLWFIWREKAFDGSALYDGQRFSDSPMILIVPLAAEPTTYAGSQRVDAELFEAAGYRVPSASNSWRRDGIRPMLLSLIDDGARDVRVVRSSFASIGLTYNGMEYVFLLAPQYGFAPVALEVRDGSGHVIWRSTSYDLSPIGDSGVYFPRHITVERHQMAGAPGVPTASPLLIEQYIVERCLSPVPTSFSPQLDAASVGTSVYDRRLSGHTSDGSVGAQYCVSADAKQLNRVIRAILPARPTSYALTLPSLLELALAILLAVTVSVIRQTLRH